jgi:epoxyqueuosine reductase
MKLLLHVCCGPCGSAAIPVWRGKDAEVTGFFLNPNIHPFLEFRRRLVGARDVAATLGVPLKEEPLYDPEWWFSEVSKGKGTRCSRCIALRLERTAKEAAAGCHEAFSTTLSISPWQDHGAIQDGGERAARLHGVRFIYEDLRAFYPESRRLSREWGIYRQKYCGCLISEWERYRAP